MTAKGTVRPGVRRAYGYTWYCPDCLYQMHEPPVGVDFSDEAMRLRLAAAEESWARHQSVMHAANSQQPTANSQGAAP